MIDLNALLCLQNFGNEIAASAAAEVESLANEAAVPQAQAAVPQAQAAEANDDTTKILAAMKEVEKLNLILG